jgi:hypothetical protein
MRNVTLTMSLCQKLSTKKSLEKIKCAVMIRTNVLIIEMFNTYHLAFSYKDLYKSCVEYLKRFNLESESKFEK